MSVTVTVQDLAVSLGVAASVSDGEDPPTYSVTVPHDQAEILTRQLATATELILARAPLAPDEAHNEAAVRLVAWLYDTDPSASGRFGGDPLTHSGAGAVLAPWRRQSLLGVEEREGGDTRPLLYVQDLRNARWNGRSIEIPWLSGLQVLHYAEIPEDQLALAIRASGAGGGLTLADVKAAVGFDSATWGGGPVAMNAIEGVTVDIPQGVRDNFEKYGRGCSLVATMRATAGTGQFDVRRGDRTVVRQVDATTEAVDVSVYTSVYRQPDGTIPDDVGATIVSADGSLVVAGAKVSLSW